mgnify:CR=1 FL=1
MFKLYRIWKAFYIWKKTVSWRKYVDARVKLALNLFILNPILKDALLEVKLMCVKLENTSFPDLKKTENLKLFEFIEIQVWKDIYQQLFTFKNYHVLSSLFFF